MSNLENYLKGVDQQKERETQEIVVAKNPAVEKIIMAYEKWLEAAAKLIDLTYVIDVKEAYESILNGIKYFNLVYSSKDINEFSTKLKKYEEIEGFSNTGLFLSALINNSNDKEFSIITEHLNKPIHCIGYLNTKKITVIGKTGDVTGCRMIWGEIRIINDMEEYTIGKRIRLSEND